MRSGIIANHNNDVGATLHAYTFVGHHDTAGLLRMRATANTQVKVRFRQTQVAKKYVRHIYVVMLAGVHKFHIAPL